MVDGRAAQIFGDIFRPLIVIGEFHSTDQAVSHSAVLLLHDRRQHAVVAAVKNPVIGPEPNVGSGHRHAGAGEEHAHEGRRGPKTIGNEQQQIAHHQTGDNAAHGNGGIHHP